MQGYYIANDCCMPNCFACNMILVGLIALISLVARVISVFELMYKCIQIMFERTSSKQL